MGTALSLSHAGMGDDLLHAVQTCMLLELEDFLKKWCRRLHIFLRTGDSPEDFQTGLVPGLMHVMSHMTSEHVL